MVSMWPMTKLWNGLKKVTLADRVIHKGGYALDPRGTMYTEENIKERLAKRNLMDELRSSGLITGGPAQFNTKNIQNFANQLDRLLTQLTRK
jgi:uncharacterized protein YaiI (UPF0178 family)